jgi:hypothetical protein
MKKLLVILAAIALVWAFAVPASAVDWNFYGSARMETWYDSRDYGDASNPAGTDDKDSQTDWNLETSSRIGANVKAENIKGQIELGINESTVTSRRVYGVWDFGGGKLKVGKDYTPVKQFISSQAAYEDLGLLGIGTAYGSRHGQIALSMGNFTIALVENAASTLELTAIGLQLGDTDIYFPKVEASFGMAMDQFSFNIIGGFQTFEVQDVVSLVNSKKKDITYNSWTVGADGTFNFGPAYVAAAASYGVNVGNAGWHIASLYAGAPDFGVGGFGTGGYGLWDGDDDVDDTKTTMFALVGGFKMSDTVNLEAGFGWRKDDPDANYLTDATYWSAYANATIALAPGVWIIPEVSYFDWGESNIDVNDNDLGKEILVGAKWQIDF